MAKPLKILLADGQYELAAYRLVYGLVKAQIKQNGRKKNCHLKK
ncbi:MAG: hypothetical protein U9R04_06110 [Chloroflexota bacterium]|nr:hypothetical protein [Chloroflexota bacterium]